jgi:ferredoxin
MPIVKFVKEKKEIDVPEGANLRTEALKAGIHTNQGFMNGIGRWANSSFANCHGLGLCGTCRVLITKGMENTNKLTLREYLKFKTVVPTGLVPDPIPPLAYIGHEDTMRLACCTTVHGDIEVETGPEINLFGENFFS